MEYKNLKKEGKYIIFLRCKDTKIHITGSEKRPCILCGELVWVSPALQKHTFDGVLCTRCVKDEDLKDAKVDMKVQLEVLGLLENQRKIIAS